MGEVMTDEKKFTFQIPPQMQLALGAALKEVGRVGVKAFAAGVRSVAVDVRKAVKDADEYLKGVEERAEGKSKDGEK
jgi:hypothetical protein